MASIYSKAPEVSAWLGSEVEQTHQFVEYVNGEDEDAGYSPDILSKDFMYAMACEYWYRIWTFQELLLAKSIILLWVSRKMRWEQLIRFRRRQGFERNDKQSFGTSHISRIHGKILELEQLNGFRRGYKRRCLLDMANEVNVTGGRDCSRVHDRIYGILGLVTCGHDSERNFPVDFSSTLLQLFLELVRRSLSNEVTKTVRRALDILGVTQSMLMSWELDERLNLQLRATEIYSISQVSREQDRLVLYKVKHQDKEPKSSYQPGPLFECFKKMLDGIAKPGNIIYKFIDLNLALILRPAPEAANDQYQEMDFLGLCFGLEAQTLTDTTRSWTGSLGSWRANGYLIYCG